MNTPSSITINGITLSAPRVPRQNEVLTSEVLGFLAKLHARFAPRIEELDVQHAVNVTAGGENGTFATSWHALIEKHLIEPPSTIVRPRGLGRAENRMLVDGGPLSGGLVDFGIYIHRTARRLLASGRAPYVSIPALQSEEELMLWQDLFAFAEEELGLPSRTIRAIQLREFKTAA